MEYVVAVVVVAATAATAAAAVFIHLLVDIAIASYVALVVVIVGN